jgi:putative oxidoreductase
MKGMMDTCGRMLYKPSLGLLLIRIATGLVFVMHGWMKFNNVDMVNGMLSGFGFPAGTAMFITYLELIGGAALILGILPRIFAILFAFEMLVAIYVTGFFSNGYSKHELEIVLLLLSLGIAFAGSGRWSVWAVECRNCGGMSCTDEHPQSVPAHL